MSNAIMTTYLVNHEKIRVYAKKDTDVLVNLENVYCGMRVKRGVHWRPSWKDDVDKSTETIPSIYPIPKPRVHGTIVGFTNSRGILIGRNAVVPEKKREYNRISLVHGPGWAVVRWDVNTESIYPIGTENLYCLLCVDSELSTFKNHIQKLVIKSE
tara:strand:- start:140 stop:607 length:468 start_codon:yes stop_codon:yes gene_type:complete